MSQLKFRQMTYSNFIVYANEIVCSVSLPILRILITKMIKWPKSVKLGQKAPCFMPQLKNKVDDLYQFHLFFKECVVVSNLIVFQEAVVISSYLNFNKTWTKCHFPIKAHDKTAFWGYLNVIVCTAKT